MTKKQIAAVVAAILAFAGSFGTAAASLSTSSNIEARLANIEKAQAVTDSRYEEILRRLDDQSADIKDLLRRVK